MGSLSALGLNTTLASSILGASGVSSGLGNAGLGASSFLSMSSGGDPFSSYFSATPFIQMLSNPLMTTSTKKMNPAQLQQAMALLQNSDLASAFGLNLGADDAKTADSKDADAKKDGEKPASESTNAGDAAKPAAGSTDTAKAADSKDGDAKKEGDKPAAKPLPPIFDLLTGKSDKLTLKRSDLMKQVGISGNVDNPDEDVEITAEQAAVLMGGNPMMALLGGAGQGAAASNPLAALMGGASASNPLAALLGGGSSNGLIGGGTTDDFIARVLSGSLTSGAGSTGSLGQMLASMTGGLGKMPSMAKMLGIGA